MRKKKDSVTHWIEQVKAGSEGEAQQELFDRYFERLVRLARRKLQGQHRRVADEEDVALSALDSFFERAPRNCFPQLHDRTNLWALLVKITARKVVNHVKWTQAKKRGEGKVRGNSVVQDAGLGNEQAGFEKIVGKDPTPEFLSEVAEQYRRLFDLLKKDELRQMAQLKLEGYTNAEIAKRFEVSNRTIDRKLLLIRDTWSHDISDTSP